jgi:hypothetical protein
MTRRPLMIVLVCYEAVVISVILAAGVSISRAQGGTFAAAAPILVIGLAESLRVPTAGYAVSLGWTGRIFAAVALAAIALASAEGLAIVFESFIDNRLVNVLQAQHRVEVARQAADAEGATIADLTGQVTELVAQVAALAKSIPQPPPSSNKTCTWRGQRVTCSADSVAATTYAASMKAYDARLADLTGRRSGLQARVDAARAKRSSAAALADAERALDDQLQLSVMHRLAASIYGVRASEVTEGQFNALKRFVVLGLACTISLLSAVVSVIAHMQPKSDKPSKLARAVRAMVAARRKTIRRLQEKVRVEYRDRTRFIHVPVDPVSGRVLDPDVPPSAP